MCVSLSLVSSIERYVREIPSFRCCYHGIFHCTSMFQSVQATADGRWGRYGLGALVHTADTPLCVTKSLRWLLLTHVT